MGGGGVGRVPGGGQRVSFTRDPGESAKTSGKTAGGFCATVDIDFGKMGRGLLRDRAAQFKDGLANLAKRFASAGDANLSNPYDDRTTDYENIVGFDEGHFEPRALNPRDLTSEGLEPMRDFRDGKDAWSHGAGKAFRTLFNKYPPTRVFGEIMFKSLEAVAERNEKIAAAEARGEEIPLSEDLKDLGHLFVDLTAVLASGAQGIGAFKAFDATATGAIEREIGFTVENPSKHVIEGGRRLGHVAVDVLADPVSLRSFGESYARSGADDWLVADCCSPQFGAAPGALA